MFASGNRRKYHENSLKNTVKNLFWSRRSIKEIRNEPLADLFKKVIKSKGQIKIFSEFPFIGRGNIQRENIVSHEAIEKKLDEVLK